MNPRGISIAGLMGIVLVCGLGVAALRSPTMLWTNAGSTVVLSQLLTAVLGATFLRGADRAYWTGFALFGGVYLLVVNWSWIGAQFGHDPTSGFGELADRSIPAEISPAAVFTPTQGEISARRSIEVGNFVQIGRLSITLLPALAGGSMARVFAMRTESQARASETTSPPRDPS